MNVVIIGGVAAGMSCAAKLKRAMGDNVNVTVFEKTDTVSYGACGIPFYVSGHVREVDSLVARTAGKFAADGIQVRLRHTVARVDTEKKTVEGIDSNTGNRFSASYDKLVMGSGARARRIPPMDQDRDNLFTVRNLDDATGIRHMLEGGSVGSVVIVGAGFVGMEMAEACVRRGRKGVLVEFAGRVLSVFDPEVSDRAAGELRDNGVDVRTDSMVTALNSDGDRIVSVEVENRGKREVVPANLVLNCVGIVPNTEFIDVDKAPNGAIVVNERMETSAPDVYAAGDCSVMTSFITRERQYAPLGTNANKQGKMIAQLLAGEQVAPLRLLGSSAVRVFGLDLAKVGLSEEDARRQGLDYKTNTITGNSSAPYYGSEKVTIKLVYGAKTRLLLGAQVVGQGVVVPRANYFAIAISAGMTIDDFGYIDLCYSPPFSGVWDAALIAATTAK